MSSSWANCQKLNKFDLAQCVLTLYLQYSTQTHVSSSQLTCLTLVLPPPNQSSMCDNWYGHRSVLGLQKIVSMKGHVMQPYICNERYAFQIICCARRRSWNNMFHGHLLARLILNYNLTTNYLSMIQKLSFGAWSPNWPWSLVCWRSSQWARKCR